MRAERSKSHRRAAPGVGHLAELFAGRIDRFPAQVLAGALMAATLLQVPAAGAVTLVTVTREVAYTYDAATGQVNSEQVDPGLDQCVETDYGLDNFGNRHTLTVKPCASTSATATFNQRVTTNDFLASDDPNNKAPASGYKYPAGAYLTHATTGSAAVSTETLAAYDSRFGASVSQVSVALQDASKNVAKRSVYDSFGRIWREYAPVKRLPDNSVVESYVEHRYVYCYPTAAAGCLAMSASSVQVTYDSGRLVDANGSATTTASVPFTSAYYVETTPYDSAGNVIGAKARLHYDALNREIAQETQSYDGRWTRTLTGYDQLGLQAVQFASHFGRDASGTVLAVPAELMQWTAERDLLQRPIDQRHQWRGTEGAAVQTLVSQVAYNGLETTATTPSGSTPDGIARVSAARKSPLGQVVQTVNADGATLNSAYDPVGNLVNTVDALGNTTTTTYTNVTARHKTGMVDPDMGSWSYVFDALGQLKQQSDARGVQTNMTYDDIGRLVVKSSPHFVSRWYYDKNPDGSWCAYGMNALCYSQLGDTTAVDSTKIEYDTLARAFRSTVTLDRPYISSRSFDDLGRVAAIQYPTGFGLQYAYSPSGGSVTPGVVTRVQDSANAARVFWRIDTLPDASKVVDANGRMLASVLGGAITTDNHFDPISGAAFAMNAGTGGSAVNVVAQTYNWDQLGNLKKRQDGWTAITDQFSYDVLGRIVSDQLTSAADAGATRTVTVGYNAIGNILSKSDVGGYSYGARPHAVTAADGANYSYDANGNISSVTGWQIRTNTWNDFNQPDRMTSGGNSVDYLYDADYKRVRETSSRGGTVRTTYMVHPDNVGGLGFEREETRVNGVLTRDESRHYITVGGNVIGVVKTLNSAAGVSSDNSMTNYWLKDSLGSIIAVTDATGQVLERPVFDAWGRRLTPAGRVDTALAPTTGHRGYTGHEELDEVALVHMNGRVYDPTLGRFLSADSIIEAKDSLQSYNRYSYVQNNPMRYTDASGHCIWDFCVSEAVYIFAMFIGYEMTQEGNSNWKMVGTAVMMVAGSELTEAGLGNAGVGAGNNLSAFVPANTFNAGYAGNAMVSTFGVSMLTTGGDIEKSAEASLTAGAGAAIGALTTAGSWQRYSSNALLACVKASTSGGHCGPAAASAVVNEYSGDAASARNPIVSIIAGGTASVIGGGKFANGAAQSGFDYAKANPGWALDVAGKIWALPNTVVGVGVGMAGVPFGGDMPSLSADFNAIVFEKYPFKVGGGGAITIGNVIISTGDDLSKDFTQTYAAQARRAADPNYQFTPEDKVYIGPHERGHTYQYQALGIFFFPAYLFSGGAFTARSPFESAADRYGQNRGSWKPWDKD